MHINRGGFLERRKREKMASLEKDFTKRKIVSQDIYVSPRKHVFFTFLKIQAASRYYQQTLCHTPSFLFPETSQHSDSQAAKNMSLNL